MLSRDIRITTEELAFGSVALRAEIAKRRRSIKTAEENRAAGQKVMHNVLDEHYRAVEACSQLLASFEVAQRQIGHRLAELVREGSKEYAAR